MVIVEDVTTAGTSVRECLPYINMYPETKVIGLVVSVDRQEKGKSDKSALQELREEFGIKTVSLSDIKDILTYLQQKVEKGEISPHILECMLDYREKYGAD